MTDAETPPVGQEEAAAIPAPEAKNDNKDSAAKSASRSSAIWKGTAVGIGSAALVAALMYAKRRK